MTEARLTESDVRKLLADPSSNNRAETAAKLAIEFDQGNLSPSERAMAEQIFRIMVKDAEVRVREALSINLKENPNVPHDVAVTLAQDVDQVALPVLLFSELLSDDDLVQIVRSQNPQKQKAIATRAHVSATVAEAIVEDAGKEAVVALVSNDGADIPEKSLDRVIDKYGDDEAVQTPMVRRSVLPVTIVERLVHQVSENLREHLLTHHEMPPSMAADLILQARERATIGLSTDSSEDDVERLVNQLYNNGRLTPSIVLRALCMGDMKFFEYAMARRVGIPVMNARMLIHDSGALGLDGLYTKSGMPQSFYPAIRAAIAVAKEMNYDGEEGDRERYARRMLERILTQYGDLGVDFDNDDLEYLLTKMSTLPATSH
ncbi:MAG: DUF2336 domain-containing protein [Rhodospirillaceae bacterium]|nr:DUF2336 domain-containing protein [Rhodospirillaceae bacterium]